MATASPPLITLSEDQAAVQDYHAAMQSMRILEVGKPAGMRDDYWAGVRWRNKRHLELMVAKGLRGANDSNPFLQILTSNADAREPPRANLQESESERSSRASTAAMDSVLVLRAGQPPDMSDAQWEQSFNRNKAHLRIVLASNSWTNDDQAPFRAALDLPLHPPIRVGPLQVPDASVTPPTVTPAPPPVAVPNTAPPAAPPAPNTVTPVAPGLTAEQERAWQELFRQEAMRSAEALQEQMRAEQAAREAAQREREIRAISEGMGSGNRPWSPWG